ncbi:hypothetical protein C483_00165 [Natrialba hulunbeirensis JCM 10989]|uniref:Antitoxin SocA-like Panacea domain-containing protein n=1 Tax=Natrialba hulunbeirensis JCM 10989 TaxID=1227493 RepID=M0AFS0_9EURY|nr:hypothetical protein [Natrialba hulunbeirensis]ELY96193.1 hypothetical protein C483_00165 [Natrialba hulunbeirensis JCM 10989]
MASNDTDATADNPSDQLLVPLAFLRLNHQTAIRGVTRFQALIFLAQQGGLPSDPINHSIDEVFQFTPHKRGPYSSTLTETLDTASPHYISRSEVQGAETASAELEITDDGITVLNANAEVLPIELIQVLKLTKSLYNSMPVVELLDKISAAYPEYVSNK